MFKKIFIFFAVFGFTLLTNFPNTAPLSFSDKKISIPFQMGVSAQGNNNQNKGSQQQALGVANQGNKLNFMGLAMGAMFASQCNPPTNVWPCIAAGLSFLDAMTAKNASNNGLRTCGNLGNNCQLDSDYSPGNGPTTPQQKEQEQEILTTLSDNGFNLNEENGSVTGPDGKEYTSKDIADPASMMAAGATSGQAEQFMKGLANARSKALNKWKKEHGEEEQERGIASVPVSGGSGFGGSGYGQGFSGSGDVVVEEDVHLGKKKKDDDSSKEDFTKYKKDFNGQPVGIAMSNLFQIVHKKYKEKRETKKEFINKEFVRTRKRQKKW